jgi:two-component system sensor histidine kinase BaeS
MRDAGDLTVPLQVIQERRRAGGRPAARTLTARAVLVACAVALISVAVTALIAVPLAVRTVDQQARDALASEAAVVTAVLRPRLASPRTADEERVVQLLRDQDIVVYVVRAGEPDRPGLPTRVVQQVAAGQPVTDRTVLVDGRLSMVEARPLPNRSGVVLAQPARTGTARLVLRNLWLPLLAGLAAGLVAGALLARRLARPIRNAATAAARLRAGDRIVRVPVEPPAEVEDLARALNDLAAALATSEGRQREFLLSVSHELRTPLTTIRGYAEALADGVVGEDGARRAGQTMLAEAGHLDRLVSDLLVLARLEAADFPLEPVGVELAELVRGAAEAWAGRCAAVGIELRTELPDRPVPAHTDPGRLRQVVDGLLENALRIVPPGSPVVLAVRPAVAGAGADDPGYAVVEVRDGGPGLTDEDLAVAFERGALHQRYRGVRKVGSGLGLALAARLVRRLGGHIEAGHAAEGGARFTVYVPTRPYRTRTSA